MQKSGFYLVLFIQLCWVAPTADQSAAINEVQKLFPGYHLLRMAERDAETRSFLHQHLPRRNPSVIHADIDGDGYPDYALLLRSDKSQAARFVVLCSGEKPCKKVYGLDLSGYSDCAYLSADPPADMSETRTAIAGGQSPTQPTEAVSRVEA